jgi:hypothetical protein
MANDGYRAVFTQENGLAAILAPNPLCGMTIEEIAAKDIPTGVEYAIVPTTKIPNDRYFRAAWVLVGADIAIDMPRAREIHRTNIRLARDPKLATLDIEFQRCLEYGEDTSAIVAQKEALRDAPQDPAIDTAATPEELKAVWPAVLEEPLARSSASKSK